MSLQRNLQQSENCAKKVDGTVAIFYISKGFFPIDLFQRASSALQVLIQGLWTCEQLSEN